MANFSLLAKLGLNSKGFKNSLDRAQKRVDGFGKRFGKVMGGMGMKLGAIGAALAAKQIIGLGISAEETASKFKAVFGSATDEMNKKLLELQKTIPATKAELQDALSTFANMSKAFGFSSEAANAFSIEMVKIAGDVASFHNLKPEEAFQKLRSAISGEMEPLKALGVVINEDRIKAEALNMGIIKQGEALSVAGKTMAIYNILVKDLGDANGDAAATANSAANKLKFLRQEIVDNATSMGSKLTPAIAVFTGGLLTFISTIVDGTEKLGKFIGQLLFMGGMDEKTFAAKLELEGEGAFDGLGGRGGTKKRAKLIAERVRLNEELAEAKARAREEERKAKEEELKNSKDVAATLKKQIEDETDPRRKQALEDRLKSAKAILELLNEQQVALKKLNEEEGKTGSDVGDKGTGGGKNKTSGKGTSKAKNDLSLGDYRNILREEGVKGSAQIAEAKRMMNEDAAKFDSGKLEGEFAKDDIAKGLDSSDKKDQEPVVEKLEEIRDVLEGKFVNE